MNARVWQKLNLGISINHECLLVCATVIMIKPCCTLINCVYVDLLAMINDWENRHAGSLESSTWDAINGIVNPVTSFPSFIICGFRNQIRFSLRILFKFLETSSVSYFGISRLHSLFAFIGLHATFDLVE